MDQGVRLVNIGPSDIIDGETKTVLGLLWVLILHFAINGNQQVFADASLTDSTDLTHRVQRNRSFRGNRAAARDRATRRRSAARSSAGSTRRRV